MKRLLFLTILLCCLIICAAASADREVSVTTLEGVSGTIRVPDEVTLIVEEGGPNGIICNENEGYKTFSLSSYQMSEGTIPFGSQGMKVVVLELGPKTIDASRGTPLTSMIPITHSGTLQSAGNGALVLESFTYHGDQAEGKAMTEAEWNEYNTYIKDLQLEYTAEAVPAESESDHNIDIHQKEPAYTLDILGNSKVTIDGSVEWHLLYFHNSIQIKYGLIIDNLALESLETGELKLMIPIPLCALGLTAEGEGSIGATFSQYFEIDASFNIGFEPIDFQIHADHSSGKSDVFGDEELDLFLGAEIGPEVDLEVFAAGIVYKLGVTLKYRAYQGHYFVEDRNRYLYHACDRCRYKGLFPQIGPLEAEITVAEIFSKGYELIPALDMEPLVDHYWSDTFSQNGEGTCPLIAYRLDVHVQDQNGKEIQGADVTYQPGDEKHFKDVITAKTDMFGNAKVYIPLKDFKDPNPVKLTASIQDPLNPHLTIHASKDITEKGIPKKKGSAADEEETPPDPEKATLTLDTSAQAIYFSDTGSGTASGMPQTIYYHASLGNANIPDTYPVKSGMQFTGWNTEADGSGLSVAPGSQFGSTEDVTLYAQWELVSRNYIIQYNANGGEWAPDGQVVPLNQSAVLTDVPARWEHHHFLGWAETDDAFEPKYPYGQSNTYVPTGEEFIVTLYAVWSFDPVIPPIRIHFDLNGAPQERAPSDQWIENPSWMTIPSKSIHWDEIHFLAGWSKDPDAAEASFLAGRSYYFTEDTTLYAVWDQYPLCTLSFRDPAGKDAANMPEDILFVPQVSTKVSVPDTIPKKSGRHFTGWNTRADGTGKAVAPGTVLELSGDTVLYAQWEVIGTRWMVRFDANGGESAPEPQFAKAGEAMTLTTEQAQWSEHRFLGWSRSDTADMPEYPAEQVNIIPYNPSETAMTLYAVWGFKPVEEPIRISFDMNGGPAGQKPADQWVPAGSWLSLSSDIPTWDGQHTFLGWSTSARSATAEYPAGSSVSFTDSTVLYAIWKAEYRITEGDGSVWRAGKTGGLRFVADGDILYFRELQIDGKTVPESSYRLSSGSTVAELPASFLNTLGPGKHSIRFVYSDGSASGSFTVDKTPVTGDDSEPALWGLTALCGLGLGLCLCFRKKRRGRGQ